MASKDTKSTEIRQLYNKEDKAEWQAVKKSELCAKDNKASYRLRLASVKWC